MFLMAIKRATHNHAPAFWICPTNLRSMATPLDFSEQEQLEQVKAFWQRYGTLITGFLLLVALVYGGWVAWGAWKNKQSMASAALYEELDRAAQAGDTAKAVAVFKDMVARYPQAIVTLHGGLLAAKLQLEKTQPDAAIQSLQWVAGQGTETTLSAIASLRLAGVLLDQQKYAAALQQLSAVTQPEFAALAADRRGDVLAAQGQKSAARDAYTQALQAMESQVSYRRLIEAKLAAMGGEVVAMAHQGVVASASAPAAMASAGSRP
jgi:predicted negative regulator of RcsB-dependent stress response